MSPTDRPRRMHGFPPLAAVMVALAVAACAPAPPHPDNPYSGTAASPPTARANAGPPPASKAAPGPVPAEPAPAPDTRTAKAIAPPPPEPPPEPLPEPGEMSGLGAEAIRTRLGEPAFIRTDPPAALWQYRRDGCVLDLYLFETDTRLSVRHFEFRPDPRQDKESGAEADAPLDARKCYAALIRAEDVRAGR